MTVLDEIRDLVYELGVEPDTVDRVLRAVQRRLEGDYPIDQYGFDVEFTERIHLPLMSALAREWFRVEVRGAHHLPVDGSALMVANHGGMIPVDAMVLQSVVFDAVARHLRLLAASLVFSTPVVADFARRTGSTLACAADAERLLADGHLVGVFPEGFKGLGKPITERYRLKRFGRGGFVATAIRAQVPIIPVSIVGGDEAYPQIGNLARLAEILGLPYFPVTPLFPWLGPVGLIPLPSKWVIDIGEPVSTRPWRDRAGDPRTIFAVTDQVRQHIQARLHTLLTERRSAFW